jgi:hypothetical protein
MRATHNLRARSHSKMFFDPSQKKKSRRLQAIGPSDLEEHIKKAGKRRSRGNLQNEIAALRGFLRFLAAGAGSQEWCHDT